MRRYYYHYWGGNCWVGGKLLCPDEWLSNSDPFLRRAIPQMFAWEDIPVMVGMSLLADMHTKNAGFPLGGSLQFSEKIAVGIKPTVGNRYLELDDRIHYESQVEKILIEKHQAMGVRLYNNEECYAVGAQPTVGNRVISACDGHNTLFGLLDRQYVPREIQRYYDGHLPIHSQLQVSLGVNRDLSVEAHWTTHLLDEPAVIAGEKRYEIGVKHYCFDPSLAPPGKSVLMVVLTTNYDYWQRIYGRWRSLSASADASLLSETLLLRQRLRQRERDAVPKAGFANANGTRINLRCRRNSRITNSHRSFRTILSWD